MEEKLTIKLKLNILKKTDNCLETTVMKENSNSLTKNTPSGWDSEEVETLKSTLISVTLQLEEKT